jgi:hypothetical protein
MTKNKNKFEFSIESIIIIVGLAVLFSLSMFFIYKSIKEPEFIVTENVSHTERVCNYTYNDSVYRFAENEFGELYEVYQNVSEIKSEEISCSIFMFFLSVDEKSVGEVFNKHEFVSSVFLRNETIYEYIEVDEIMFPTSYIQDDNRVLFFECMPKGNKCLLENISKEDLTFDWLDKNAECLNYELNCWQCNNNISLELMKEAQEVCVEDYRTAFCREINSHNYKCSKYKIGNYTIEVLK